MREGEEISRGERGEPLKSEEGGAGGEVSRNNNKTDKNTQGTRLVLRWCRRYLKVFRSS